MGDLLEDQIREQVVREQMEEGIQKIANPPRFEVLYEQVNHPNHYGGDDIYETIKVLRAWLTRDEFVGFLKGNAIKYHSRLGRKPGVRPRVDAEKGNWYAEYLAKFLAEEEQIGHTNSGTR